MLSVRHPSFAVAPFLSAEWSCLSPWFPPTARNRSRNCLITTSIVFHGPGHACMQQRRRRMKPILAKVNQLDYIIREFLRAIYVSIYARRFRICNRPRPRNASSQENINTGGWEEEEQGREKPTTFNIATGCSHATTATVIVICKGAEVGMCNVFHEWILAFILKIDSWPLQQV